MYAIKCMKLVFLNFDGCIVFHAYDENIDDEARIFFFQIFTKY